MVWVCRKKTCRLYGKESISEEKANIGRIKIWLKKIEPPTFQVIDHYICQSCHNLWCSLLERENIFFIKGVDYYIWKAINGLFIPTHQVNHVIGNKPRDLWTKEDSEKV